MSREIRPLVLALLIIVAGCTASSPSGTESGEPNGVDPSAATASATPSSSVTWTKHTSDRFGFTLELPGEWRYRPATEDWPAGVYPAAGAAYTDNFEQPPASFPTVDIVTRSLETGETRELFLAWLDERNAEICSVEETSEISVDGTDARLQRQTCGYNAWEVVAFDADRVYLMYWLGEPSQVESDWPLFERIIASFRFG